MSEPKSPKPTALIYVTGRTLRERLARLFTEGGYQVFTPRVLPTSENAIRYFLGVVPQGSVIVMGVGMVRVSEEELNDWTYDDPRRRCTPWETPITEDGVQAAGKMGYKVVAVGDVVIRPPWADAFYRTVEGDPLDTRKPDLGMVVALSTELIQRHCGQEQDDSTLSEGKK